MAGYGTDEGFQTYADANGYEVPAGSVTAARNRGSVYIDGTYGSRFVGVPTGGYEQERAWPRSGAVVSGALIPDAVIPVAVVHASYEAALQEAREPGSLSTTTSAAGRVVREKVGDLEVQYAGPAQDAVADATPVMTVVDGLLSPFLAPAVAAGIGIWSVG